MAGGVKRIGNGTSRARGIRTGVDNNPSRQGTLKIDNLQFPIVTAWESTTLSIPSQWGTVTVSEAKMRRVGDCVQVEGSFRAGTLTAGQPPSIPLPTGLSLDGNKLGTSQRHFFGYAWRCSSISTTIPVANLGVWPMFYDSALGNGFLRITDTAPGTPAGALFDGTRAVNGLFSSNDAVSFRYEVPIQGWDSTGTGSIEEVIGSTFFDLNANNPIVVAGHTGPLGYANNVDTDFPSVSMTLAPGKYFIEFGCTFRIDDTTAPTYVIHQALLTDASNTSIVNQNGSNFNLTRAFMVGGANGITRFQSANTGNISAVFTSQQFIKLRVNSNATGGTGINREAYGGYIIATKLDD